MNTEELLVTDEMRAKQEALKNYLKELGSIAIAFSGGVDSTYLIYTAHEALGDQALAITAKSESFPARELEQAVNFCGEYGIRQVIVNSSELEVEGFADNPVNRCYLCKKGIYSSVFAIARENGIEYVGEGSNMDDLGDYRPGLQAIEELGVKSPLREVKLYKKEIRALSKELGLPTWDKPSAACLASRFVYGERITKEKLGKVERAENVLQDLGFRERRVRMHGETLARIEVAPAELEHLMACREEIVAQLRQIGFTYVTADLQGYRTGSMNEVL